MTRPPVLLALTALFGLRACETLNAPPEGGLLRFEVREVAWDPPTPRIVLFVSDDKTYPCFNYLIENALSIQDHAIRVEMSGAVKAPSICLTAIGPAQIRAPLPIAEGRYALDFVRGGMTDRYTLTVTASVIQIATVQAHFTRPSARSFPRPA